MLEATPDAARLRSLIVVLVVWLLTAGTGWAQSQETGQAAVWDLGTLAPGKVYPTTVSATNVNCAGRHHLEVRFEGDIADLIRVPEPHLRNVRLGQTKTTRALVDLTEASPGVVQGALRVRCLTCGACSLDHPEIRVRLQVEGDQGACSCSELERLAEAAQRKAEAARAEAERLAERLEAAEERSDELEDALAAAQARRDALDRYFDESSWISGDRGRITRGDLELLRDARSKVFERWKSGEITAQEASDEWGEIDSDSLDRLRREKRRERAEADAEVERAGEEAEAAEAERQAVETELGEARRRAEEAEAEARRARDLYEACLAECARLRSEVRELIDERIAEIEDVESDCPPEESAASAAGLRELEEEAARLAEEVPRTIQRLADSFRRMAEAIRIHGIGESIPEEGFTGLWDWGEDLGRALGRVVGLEEELGTVGDVVSTTTGVVVEGELGFPVGTDLVAKGVPAGYKILLAKLDPQLPGFFRCLLKAGIPPGELIPVWDRANRAWKAIGSGQAGRELRRLGEQVGELGEQIDDLRATRSALLELREEALPERPQLPGEGASLEELRESEEALRRHRDRLDERCRRLRELRDRLRRQIAEARGTLRAIETLRDRLARYDRGIRDYLEVHRRTAFECA